MRIFFAGAHEKMMPELMASGVRNFLVSYESPRKCEEIAAACAPSFPGNAFILDSGAFSAWNSGKTIRLNEYIGFAKEFIRRHSAYVSHVYVVNLDVIPGRQGEIPTTRQVEDAAKEGWANMVEMEKAGLTPLHIFHQGEDFKWLDQISKRHRYIGISPSNDAGLKEKDLWLRSVYSMIRARNMTHGFAVTSKRLMAAYPWYSVDSTSWLAPGIYGKTVFTRSFESLGLNSRCKSHVEYILKEGVKNLLKIERQLTGLWKARGVSWGGEDGY